MMCVGEQMICGFVCCVGMWGVGGIEEGMQMIIFRGLIILFLWKFEHRGFVFLLLHLICYFSPFFFFLIYLFYFILFFFQN